MQGPNPCPQNTKLNSGLRGRATLKKVWGFQQALKNSLEVRNRPLQGYHRILPASQPHSISAVVQKLETAVFNWGWVLPSPFLFSGLSSVSGFVFPCNAGRSILGHLASAKHFKRGNILQPY